MVSTGRQRVHQDAWRDVNDAAISTQRGERVATTNRCEKLGLRSVENGTTSDGTLASGDAGEK